MASAGRGQGREGGGGGSTQRAALARGLSALLVGSPVPAAAAEDAAALSGDSEPLRRNTSQLLNRTRVQENRRLLAQQLMEEWLPLVGCTVILVPGTLLLLTFIASIAIYIQGWLVLANYSAAPCDYPLKWWLLSMLVIPMIQCHLFIRQEVDSRWRRLQGLLLFCATLAGVFMVIESKTCKSTNPELYQYAKLYVMFQAVFLTTMFVFHFFLHCGFVALVFWLHRHGMLDSGPGPSHAARPGLIDEFETVVFKPELFADRDDDADRPECSICQEEYKLGEEIKKTPCGHYFHEKCLGEWLERYARTCPLCREDLEQAVDPGSAAP